MQLTYMNNTLGLHFRVRVYEDELSNVPTAG